MPGVGAGRVDEDVGLVLQHLDAFGLFAGGGEAFSPEIRLLLREVGRGEAGLAGVIDVDPGEEVGTLEIGKRQQQVREIPLRIDDEGRDVVDRRLFEQGEAQARLAAAGHADADGVGDEVLRVVEDQVFGIVLLRRLVVVRTEVKDAELLEVLHGCSVSSVAESSARNGGDSTTSSGEPRKRFPPIRPAATIVLISVKRIGWDSLPLDPPYGLLLVLCAMATGFVVRQLTPATGIRVSKVPRAVGVEPLDLPVPVFADEESLGGLEQRRDAEIAIDLAEGEIGTSAALLLFTARRC